MPRIDMQEVRRWARRYYDMGLNPIPSRSDCKRPALKSWKRYQEERIPEEWLRRWWTPNIQLALGVRWGLCVVDIDGMEGEFQWARMSLCETEVNTWISRSIGSPGCHVWFRIPSVPLVYHSFPTTLLWKGGDHEEVKVLGDGCLAMAPPSIHPDRGVRGAYCWVWGPEDQDDPQIMPDWLLSRFAESCKVRVIMPRPRPEKRPLPSGRKLGIHYQRDEVLFGLGDFKHEIAARYGLEVRSTPNPAGFHPCRSIDLTRNDNNWSCTIDPRTGVYHDWGTGERLSFFSLLMRLSPEDFPDFSNTVDVLGTYVFGGKPCPWIPKS